MPTKKQTKSGTSRPNLTILPTTPPKAVTDKLDSLQDATGLEHDQIIRALVMSASPQLVAVCARQIGLPVKMRRVVVSVNKITA